MWSISFDKICIWGTSRSLSSKFFLYLYRIHFWPGLRQLDYYCDVYKECSPEGGLASLHRNIWNINQRKKTRWRLSYPKMFLLHSCMPVTLAPDPIRVQSCVCCLFWTNRNMAVTSIFLSISIFNQSYESFNRRYQ